MWICALAILIWGFLNFFTFYFRGISIGKQLNFHCVSFDNVGGALVLFDTFLVSFWYFKSKLSIILKSEFLAISKKKNSNLVKSNQLQFSILAIILFWWLICLYQELIINWFSSPFYFYHSLIMLSKNFPFILHVTCKYYIYGYFVYVFLNHFFHLLVHN